MPERLAAVPESPHWTIVYLRQSVKKEESISLDVQERASLDYCARKGYRVLEIVPEQRSGLLWEKRPGFQRVLQRVRDGEATRVVVYRWSRLSRMRFHQALALNTIEQAGAEVESATEPFDTTTAAGEFGRDTLLNFAAFQSKLIGEQWREAHQHRLDRGLPHGGGARFGYKYTKEDGYEIDPDTADAVEWGYREYVAGRSFRSIEKDYNRRGILDARGNRWVEGHLARVMDAGFAAGLLPIGSSKSREFRTAIPGAHESIIDDDLWEDYQDARKERLYAPARSATPVYPYTSLIKCGDCGASMVACKGGTGQTGQTYQCYKWRKTGEGVCVTVSRTRIDKFVLKWLTDFAAEIDCATERADAEQKQQHRRRASITIDVDLRAREIAALDRQLVELTRQLTAGLVPESVYVQTRDALMGDRDEATERLTEAQRQVRRASEVPTRGAAVKLLDDWDVLPVAEKRMALKAFMRRIFIHRTEKRYQRAEVQVIAVWDPPHPIETLCMR